MEAICPIFLKRLVLRLKNFEKVFQSKNLVFGLKKCQWKIYIFKIIVFSYDRFLFSVTWRDFNSSASEMLLKTEWTNQNNPGITWWQEVLIQKWRQESKKMKKGWRNILGYPRKIANRWDSSPTALKLG